MKKRTPKGATNGGTGGGGGGGGGGGCKGIHRAAWLKLYTLSFGRWLQLGQQMWFKLYAGHYVKQQYYFRNITRAPKSPHTPHRLFIDNFSRVSKQKSADLFKPLIILLIFISPPIPGGINAPDTTTPWYTTMHKSWHINAHHQTIDGDHHNAERWVCWGFL